jgi:DNA-directed RNA polymerase alpha subunit
MTKKINEKLKSRTIDISDLCGTYSLSEMPKLLDTLKERMKFFEDENLVFIKEVKFSERLKNSLLRADFDTLNELTTQTRKDILSLNGIGVTSYLELRDVMNQYGLKLKDTY